MTSAQSDALRWIQKYVFGVENSIEEIIIMQGFDCQRYLLKQMQRNFTVLNRNQLS